MPQDPGAIVKKIVKAGSENVFKKLFKFNYMGCKEPFREPDFIKFIARSAAMRSQFDFIRTPNWPFSPTKNKLKQFLNQVTLLICRLNPIK